MSRPPNAASARPRIARSGHGRMLVNHNDFLFASYGQASKEQLLRHLADAPDIAQLQDFDQPTLANIMCERYAEAMLRRRRSS